MFLFSPIHNWQADEAVKQILVFPNELLKLEFDREMEKRIEKDGMEKASDSNAGAVYKLRAVKEGTGMYSSMIRCGSSGNLLWEDVLTYEKPNPALVAAAFQLRNMMYSDINTMVSEIDCN